MSEFGVALPEHLRDALGARDGVDPFASPCPALIRKPSARAGVGEQDGPVEMLACQCSCSCSSATTVPASRATSAATRRLVRCAACQSAKHPLAALARPATTVPAAAPSRVRVAVSAEDAALDRQVAAEQAREQRATAYAAFEETLPAKFRRPLDAVQERAVDDRLRRLATGRGTHGLSLLTYGVYGSGKTWTAYSYMRLAVQRGLLWPAEVRHGTEGEIMEPLVYAAKWEVADRLKALLNPRLKMLLIDDVGNMGRWPDVATRHATYAAVVNWLWENDKALVISTNLDLGAGNALEAWIGVAAYERVRSMIGRDPVFRDTEKRATLTAQWEREYQQYLHNSEEGR